MPALLHHAARWLAAVPTQCAVCRGWDDGRICAACRQRFVRCVPRCGRCAIAVPATSAICGGCLKHPPEFDTAFAAVDYAHPWDRLIAGFKFHEALDTAGSMAGLLASAWREAARATPSLLLPVPLSVQRLRERGYNQSWELSRRLAGILGGKADPGLLLRLRHSPHQLSLPEDDRAANVKGVFAVEPRRRRELQGREVWVLDDVMTTGATMNEIARVLKQAGASRVHAIVLARTPAPDR